MPSAPAFGVQPCVVFARSVWHDHRARRFGLAAPGTASGEGRAWVSVQPLGDAGVECANLGVSAQLIEARTPIISAPIGRPLPGVGRSCQRWADLIFRSFSSFSAFLPHLRVFTGAVLGNDRISYQAILQLGA